MTSQARVRLAWVLLIGSLLGWPATHLLMVMTDPRENTWVFHVLLGISFLSLVLTSVNIVFTSDVRREQDRDCG